MSETATPTKNRRIERRRSPKGSVKATCRKGTLDLGANLAIRLLDVSETGVRLVLREALELREEVAITLEGPNHPRPLRRVGRIMWYMESADGTVCAGILFDKRLPYLDLYKLT